MYTAKLRIKFQNIGVPVLHVCPISITRLRKRIRSFIMKIFYTVGYLLAKIVQLNRFTHAVSLILNSTSEWYLVWDWINYFSLLKILPLSTLLLIHSTNPSLLYKFTNSEVSLIIDYFNLYSVRNNFCGNGHLCWG
jgi:hypothetical protein